MARKKNVDGQLALGAQPAPPAPPQPAPEPAQPAAPLPALVEYVVSGEAWRCSQFPALAAEFERLTPGQMPMFHDLASTKERGWFIVRRLFGIQPVITPKDYSLADMRVWPREELREELGLSRPQLQGELDAVRGAWLRVVRPPTPAAPPPSPVPRGELPFADDAILKQFDFRVRFKDSDERDFFVRRVREYEKLLFEKMTTGLARNTLMTELQLHRLDELLADGNRCVEGGPEWQKNLKLRDDLNDTYQEQILKIDKLAPWAGSVVGKYALKAQLSEVTEAIQQYQSTGGRELADGIFTLAEIEVELLRSVQAPEPQYRMGLIVYLNQAKANLWNPHWKDTVPASIYRKLDAMAKAAAMAIGDTSGEALPDVEKDGVDGEFKIEVKQ